MRAAAFGATSKHQIRSTFGRWRPVESRSASSAGDRAPPGRPAPAAAAVWYEQKLSIARFERGMFSVGEQHQQEIVSRTARLASRLQHGSGSGASRPRARARQRLDTGPIRKASRCGNHRARYTIGASLWRRARQGEAGKGSESGSPRQNGIIRAQRLARPGVLQKRYAGIGVLDVLRCGGGGMGSSSCVSARQGGSQIRFSVEPFDDLAAQHFSCRRGLRRSNSFELLLRQAFVGSAVLTPLLQ